MAVQDVRTMTPRGERHIVSQSGMKTGRPFQRRNCNSLLDQPTRPCPSVVQAADRHWNFLVQPAYQLDDEPFGASWIQAQDDLQNSW